MAYWPAVPPAAPRVVPRAERRIEGAGEADFRVAGQEAVSVETCGVRVELAAAGRSVGGARRARTCVVVDGTESRRGRM